MKQRDSVKLKKSVKNTKPEPRDHHQSQSHFSQSSLALLATGSLELKLKKVAIKEHKSQMNT